MIAIPRILLCALFCSLSFFSFGQFLRTQDKSIVNQDGDEVLLRGIGPGGWLLMEGYMMKTAGVAGTQHEFKNRLIDLMGDLKTDEFFNAWRQHHFTERDVDSLKSWGFNSIRVPMHYNLFTLAIEEEPVAGSQTWLSEGFEIIDELLRWCSEREIYLILDLHAAPGGQGYNADISDYDPTKPSLWESEANKEKTVELWRKLAERYKDEPWIGGYDLINEPNWDLPGGTQLRQLYIRITNAIRSTGDQHIIFIEGNWFANDFTGLTPPWDEELVYSFHKYWNTNWQTDINWVLSLRDQFNVPLWMGESGENSNTWYTDAVSLLEQNNIGWAWWTMRKIESINSPYSIDLNEGYQKIINYWNGDGPRPSQEDAFQALMELVENLKIENSDYRPDVVDALIRQVNTDLTKPFKNHEIPGMISMSDYDLGKNKFAYFDTDVANYQSTDGQFTAWNAGWSYRNDGVDIESNDGEYHVGFVSKNEWIQYTVHISRPGAYKLTVNTAAEQSGGKFHFTLDDQAIVPIQIVANSGGWTSFQEKIFSGVILQEGKHYLKFHVDGEIPFNIKQVNFSYQGDASEIGFASLYGETGDESDLINLHLNKPIDQSVGIDPNEFEAVLLNKTISIKEITYLSDRVIQIRLAEHLKADDQLIINYNGNTIKSVEGQYLTHIDALLIYNSLAPRHLIPGKIEAEEYSEMVGFQLETCLDDEGGQNLGYVNPGDFAVYPVFSSREGAYKLSLRVAGLNANGKLSLSIIRPDSIYKLTDIVVEPTGGWQSWKTIEKQVELPAGAFDLRLDIVGSGEFNLNWLHFRNVVTGIEKNSYSFVYPNPSNGYAVNVTGFLGEEFSIYNLNGQVVLQGKVEKEINLEGLSKGVYIIDIGGEYQQKLIVE